MIRVITETEGEFIFDRDAVVAEIEKEVTAKGLGNGEAEIVLTVVGEETMKKLHKKYMETFEVTDVLSFPQIDNGEGFLAGPDGVLRLGDIVICFPVALRQAGEAGSPIDAEMAFLAGHGCRHLLGEHHE